MIIHDKIGDLANHSFFRENKKNEKGKDAQNLNNLGNVIAFLVML